MSKNKWKNVKKSKKKNKSANILKCSSDTIIGTFQKNRNFGFVVPSNKNINGDIFISKKNFSNARNNQKVVVKITKEAKKGRKAEGRIVEVLSRENSAESDMTSLVMEYNLPYEFPEPVLKEAKELEKTILPKETSKQKISKLQKKAKNRLDIRDKIIFTIDGEDAKDLDDAVYVEKNWEGNYILGVSIADVSNYVEEDSQLDKEAIIRGTSVYMLNRVIPMLPKELSNGICSLNQGEDRYAITVIMEINNKGQVISSDIKKSIINVTRRMSYTDVYNILKYTKSLPEEDEVYTEGTEVPKNIFQYEEYFENFKLMAELAQILKTKREKAGSLDLDIPESKIIMDENGVAIDVQKYEVTFANEIIEQFMLTTNETVAEKFYWLEAPFIYRVHMPPDMEKITELNKFLANLGYRVKANNDSIHPTAFAEVLQKTKGKPEERIVSNLILRTLKVAQYESENSGHFGIASKYYCHFTSPIRRYPDLFIHRVISKYLENEYRLSAEEIEKYSEKAAKYAMYSSEREKIAKKVERDSVDMKKAEYMQNKIGKEYDGIISGVTSFGVFVQLPNTVEGLVRFENLGNEYYVYDENNKTLTGNVTGDIFSIGDKMRIKVIDANKELRRVAFARVYDEEAQNIDNNTVEEHIENILNKEAQQQ